MEWVENTTVVRQAWMLVSEKRVMWYKSVKETAKREEYVLAVSEDLKEHVEAVKKEEVYTEDYKEDCEEWQTLCEEAELVNEAKSSLEDMMKRSFRKEAGMSHAIVFFF